MEIKENKSKNGTPLLQRESGGYPQLLDQGSLGPGKVLLVTSAFDFLCAWKKW